MKTPLSNIPIMGLMEVWRTTFRTRRVYKITVRVFDGDGKVQESGSLFGMLLKTFPNEKSRLYSIKIHVD